MLNRAGSSRRLPQEKGERLLERAFVQREIREGRSHEYDPERQQHRALRRIGPPGPEAEWVDDGPFDRDDDTLRYRQWLNNAANDEHFGQDVHLAAILLASSHASMLGTQGS